MPGASKYSYLLKQYPETVQKEQFRIMCHISKELPDIYYKPVWFPVCKAGKRPEIIRSR